MRTGFNESDPPIYYYATRLVFARHEYEHLVFVVHNDCLHMNSIGLCFDFICCVLENVRCQQLTLTIPLEWPRVSKWTVDLLRTSRFHCGHVAMSLWLSETKVRSFLSSSFISKLLSVLYSKYFHTRQHSPITIIFCIAPHRRLHTTNNVAIQSKNVKVKI